MALLLDDLLNVPGIVVHSQTVAFVVFIIYPITSQYEPNETKLITSAKGSNTVPDPTVCDE